jgi:hypothetical protein
MIAATLLSATTFKWSQLRGQRTISDIYREAKAGRLRSSPYQKITALLSLVLVAVGMYLAFSGD